MSQRPLEMAMAATGLVLLIPLLALIAALIRLDDGGPVLFVQTRLGAGKRPFRLYKFRSMRDGQVTRVGGWLRATGLDELPQLLNLVTGDMGLIGPRPLTATDVERLKWDGPAYAVRWRMRPGLLGLAQLYAGRGKRLSWFLDRTYVRGRTLGLDLGIAAASVPIALFGKRRVRAWLKEYRRGCRVQRARVSENMSRSNARRSRIERTGPIARLSS